MHKLKSKYIKLERNQRLHNAPHPVVGLTGGIATGKSTFSDFLKKQQVPVICADELIKEIYHQKMTLDFLQDTLPQVLIEGKIDFKQLRETFFNNLQVKQKIEEFLYARLPDTFRAQCNKLSFQKFQFIVYDVPLLFEKNLQAKFDLIALVYCPGSKQIQRLMYRDNITPELAQTILDQQMSIESKRQLSHIIINNESDIRTLEKKSQWFLQEICS